MEVFDHEYNPHQWRLFIDSSNVSFKVVLHHNGNRYPSVPLDHAANVKANLEHFGSSSTTNLSGIYVVISRLCHCYPECNSGTKNTVISYAIGTAETRSTTM
jgi:hypothetical protein